MLSISNDEEPSAEASFTEASFAQSDNADSTSDRAELANARAKMESDATNLEW